MKKVLILCFILYCNNSFAQYKIINSETEEGVEFAAIFNLNKKDGTYSNADGSFNLEANKSDSIIISCVGYYSDTITDLKNHPSIIRMSPQIYNINEIVHEVNVKSKKYELGFRKEKKITTFYSHIGSEWVVFIANPNPSKKQIIETVILKTHNHSKRNVGFRIHVYDRDSLTSLPREELAHLDIIETSKFKGKQFPLNNHIIFPSSGIFIGIEWISYLKENGEKINSKGDLKLSVPLTFNVQDSLTYYRSKFFDNTWYKVNSDHPLSLVTGETNPPNLAGSIIVKEYLNE